MDEFETIGLHCTLLFSAVLRQFEANGATLQYVWEKSLGIEYYSLRESESTDLEFKVVPWYIYGFTIERPKR